MTNSRVPVYSGEAIAASVSALASVDRVIRSGRYVLGPEVAAFEEAFADYCGVEHGVGLANGTDALEVALRAVDVGPGARVVTVANAGHYASTAIRAIGAVPTFVDVDPITLTVAVPDAVDALSAQPAAIVVTHLYGQLAAIEPIVAAAAARGIPVIEDCAQAHGASRDGVRAGAFGTIGSFSFYPTKNLGAIGDGGAIVTSDEALARRIRSLRQYGWGTKYQVDDVGGRNSRLDEIQAAVLLDRLPHLDEWNAERREVAARYRDGLGASDLVLPASHGDDFVAHLYVIRTTDRDGLRSHLDAAGIDTAVHYPVADHLQPAYQAPSDVPSLPHTEEACATVVSLPCYPGLPGTAVDRVIDAIGESLALMRA